MKIWTSTLAFLRVIHKRPSLIHEGVIFSQNFLTEWLVYESDWSVSRVQLTHFFPPHNFYMFATQSMTSECLEHTSHTDQFYKHFLQSPSIKIAWKIVASALHISQNFVFCVSYGFWNIMRLSKFASMHEISHSPKKMT